MWLGVVLAVLAIAHTGPAKSSEVSCVDMGFTEALLCSSCDEFQKTIQDDDLVRECRQCCHEKDELQSTVRYASAKLKVCS
jgi:hypothetical protein